MAMHFRENNEINEILCAIPSTTVNHLRTWYFIKAAVTITIFVFIFFSGTQRRWLTLSARVRLVFNQLGRAFQQRAVVAP